MGHLDLNNIGFTLPDGRVLLRDVHLRVGEGAKVALIGPNGAGKTTLTRIIAGDLDPNDGAVTRSGGLAVMRQFIGKVRDESTVRDLLISVAPERIRKAAKEIDRTELLMMERDSEADQMEYAQALADWTDAGGYDWEVLADVCTTAAFGMPYDKAQWRRTSTLSGGEQKRVVLEALLRGPEEVLLLDEPDNYLDVPAKRWLEAQLIASPKTVLFISHDRELLDRVATRIATLEPGRGGNTLWVHPGRFATYEQARADRNAKLEEQRRRWDEEHAKLKALVIMYRQKAAYNSDMAPKLQAAETRLRRFEEAGPPEAVPLRQQVSMRLSGGRTAKRAVIASDLELRAGDPGDSSELMRPFSTGSGSGTGRRWLQRLGQVVLPAPARCRRRDPEPEHRPSGSLAGVGAHTGSVLVAGPAGLVAQTHDVPALHGRTSWNPAPRRRAPGPGCRATWPPAPWTATDWPGRRSRPSSPCPVGRRRGCRSSINCPRRSCSSTSRPTTSTCTRRGVGRTCGVRGHCRRRHPRPVVRPRVDRFIFGATGASSRAMSRCGTRAGSAETLTRTGPPRCVLPG